MAITKNTPAKSPAASTAAKTTAPKTAAANAPAKAAPRVAAKPAAKAPVVRAAAKPAAKATPAAKPEAPKRYRLLTGIDDSNFCQKVSDALNNGYELYGSPSITFTGKTAYAAQAVILKKLPKGKKKK